MGVEVAAGGALGMMQDTITNQNNQDWQNRFDILSRQRQEESAVRMQHNAYLEHNRMKSANLKADLDALRKSGMNVGLMYEGSGAGGQTIASSGTSGGNPIPMSGEGLSRGTAMGIEMANVNADLDLKAAQAEALRADAANKRANTETEDKSRDIFIENMRQSGVSTWLENIVKKVRLQGVPEENEVTAIRNAVYNSGVAYGNDAPEFKQMNADLLKTIAEERNLNTGSELNDKKIQGYWQELMNATAHADADQVRAAAIKLQTEWSTGEFINWKTWADYAEGALQLLSKAIPTKGKNPTTTIKDGYSEKNGNYSEVIKTR